MLWNLDQAYMESVYRWIKSGVKNDIFSEITIEAQEAMQDLVTASPENQQKIEKLWRLLDNRGEKVGFQSFAYGLLMGLEAGFYSDWIV